MYHNLPDASTVQYEAAILKNSPFFNWYYLQLSSISRDYPFKETNKCSKCLEIIKRFYQTYSKCTRPQFTFSEIGNTNPPIVGIGKYLSHVDNTSRIRHSLYTLYCFQKFTLPLKQNLPVSNPQEALPLTIGQVSEGSRSFTGNEKICDQHLTGQTKVMDETCRSVPVLTGYEQAIWALLQCRGSNSVFQTRIHTIKNSEKNRLIY